MNECNGLNVPLDRSIKLVSTASAASTNSTAALPAAAALNGDDTTRYQSIVGKLMYAMIATRPDLAFAVSTLGRFNAAPNATHLEAAKKTLRYLRKTSNVGLVFSPTPSIDLIGYCDSDWAGDLDSRRSTTGYAFLLSNGAISWKSRRQQTVALSSTEAEYMAVTDASKEGIWLRRLYNEIKLWNPTLHSQDQVQPQIIMVDNNGAIELAKNPKHHDRTKHIDIRHHFVREAIESKLIELQRVDTSLNTADILTKALSVDLYQRHAKGLGLQ